ncbi:MULTISPECIES: acyltransferase family protein [unclassified Limnobacter]|uniref:acyltransferase family protein n=1 Tax=unclassified Limnobacter TaxID=2630203 RepID=UPI000C394DD5|nr:MULTISPECIES: acyltransferase family protein [unclassified Limnobacter]MAZ08562.1 hypothetical protein [Sutterellaceae bacterium]|tara:strand:+ start:21119 stop:23131 length:2013 start_codon:yes stop_codon:yes gene_type:complete
MIYRPDIDGLRTLAVVPVLLFHANVVGFSGGYIGVDIFFVISGFLITSIIQAELNQGDFSIVRFYERRARRILPALFAVIAASVVAGWFLLTPAKYEQLGESMLAALLFVSNLWFWQNSGGYFAGPTDYLPLLHTWSLAVEEQFYIFFPILMMVLYRLGRRWLIPTVVVLVLGSLLLAVWATPRMPSAAFYLLPTRIWELGFGALLALGLVPVNSRKSIRELAATIGLLAILVPIFVYDRSTGFPGFAALPPVLGTALIIWAGIEKATWVSRFLAIKPMVWVGLLSYSLYLWHWPIMAFLRERLFTVHLEPIWQVVAIAASFALAWLSWRYIERPFRDRKQFKFSGARIFRLSGTGMLALGLVACALFFTSGAPQRFDASQLTRISNLKTTSSEIESCSGVRPVTTLCVFGKFADQVDPTWLVWGDSHAASMLPAFIDVADSTGESILFANKGNCPPLPDTDRSDMPMVENGLCERYRQKVLKRILSEESIQFVFLVARWPLYGRGSMLLSEGHGSFHLVKTGEAKTSQTNLEVMKSSLDAVIQKLRGAGKRVVLVEAVPEMPWHVGGRIRAEILFEVPFSIDKISLTEVERMQDSTNQVIRSFEKTEGVSVVRVAEKICAQGCPSRFEDNMYYRDFNHLSLVGAQALLTPVLRDALQLNESTSTFTKVQ